MPKEPLLICAGLFLFCMLMVCLNGGVFCRAKFLRFMKSPLSVVVLVHQCPVQKVFFCVNVFETNFHFSFYQVRRTSPYSEVLDPLVLEFYAG